MSKKSGHVYERRLIEQYIDEHGTDPVTKEPLAMDDLLTLQSSTCPRLTPAPRTAFPRPPTHSSVPSLLGALQNEYDAMVFETLELRKQYDAVRQDLAHALYTNDASMRVIARLMKERDDAREALASVHASLGGASGDVDMTHEEAPASAGGLTLPADAAAAIDAAAAHESGERRARIKRGAPAPYPTPATATNLHETQSISALHSASSPGIQALDVSANGALLLTGGLDKTVLVLERATDKVLATLQGHTQAVTAVAFSGRSNAVAGPKSSEAPLPPFAVSASADKTVRVWRHTGETYELLHVLQGAEAEITGVDVHPTDAFVGCASRDGSWALYALDSGACLLRVPPPTHAGDDGAGMVYTSFAFHPDGQLAATGTADGAIRVWDVKLGRQSALFTGHAGAVHSLHFSPNGYLLAAASRDDAHVKVWDLRKLAVARTIEATPGIEQVRFDPTAQLLAIVGADVRVMGGKTFEPCFVSEPCTLPATSVQWSPVDGALLVAGLDRAVHTYLP